MIFLILEKKLQKSKKKSRPEGRLIVKNCVV